MPARYSAMIAKSRWFRPIECSEAHQTTLRARFLPDRRFRRKLPPPQMPSPVISHRMGSIRWDQNQHGAATIERAMLRRSIPRPHPNAGPLRPRHHHDRLAPPQMIMIAAHRARFCRRQMHVRHAPHKRERFGRSRKLNATRIAAIVEFRDLNFRLSCDASCAGNLQLWKLSSLSASETL